MATKFEHAAAGEAGFGEALGGGAVGIHGGADHEDVAEPSAAGGVEGGVDAGVPTPDVAGLEAEILAAGLFDEIAEGRQFVAGRLFEVEVFAGGDNLVALGDGDIDRTFDNDELDGGVLEQGGVVVAGDADELVGGGFLDDLSLTGEVAVFGAEEADADGGRGRGEGQGEEIAAAHVSSARRISGRASS